MAIPRSVDGLSNKDKPSQKKSLFKREGNNHAQNQSSSKAPNQNKTNSVPVSNNIEFEKVETIDEILDSPLPDLSELMPIAESNPNPVRKPQSLPTGLPRIPTQPPAPVKRNTHEAVAKISEKFKPVEVNVDEVFETDEDEPAYGDAFSEDEQLPTMIGGTEVANLDEDELDQLLGIDDDSFDLPMANKPVSSNYFDDFDYDSELPDVQEVMEEAAPIQEASPIESIPVPAQEISVDMFLAELVPEEITEEFADDDFEMMFNEALDESERPPVYENFDEISETPESSEVTPIVFNEDDFEGLFNDEDSDDDSEDEIPTLDDFEDSILPRQSDDDAKFNKDFSDYIGDEDDADDEWGFSEVDSEEDEFDDDEWDYEEEEEDQEPIAEGDEPFDYYDDDNEEDNEPEKPTKKLPNKKSKKKSGSLKEKLNGLKSQIMADVKGEKIPDADAVIDDDDDDDDSMAIPAPVSKKGGAKGKPAPEKPSKGNSGAAGGKRGNIFKRIYMGIVGFFFKMLTFILNLLSSLPLIGRLFKPLVKATGIIEKIALFMPIIFLIGVVVIVNIITVPLSSNIKLPDNGAATFKNFKYDSENNAASGNIINTGEIIVDVEPEFSVYAMEPSLNPISWIVPVEVAKCYSERVYVDIDSEQEVTAICEETTGIFKRSSGVLK